MGARKKRRLHMEAVARHIAKMKARHKAEKPEKKAHREEIDREKYHNIAASMYREFREMLLSKTRSYEEVIEVHEAFKSALRKKVKNKWVLQQSFAVVNGAMEDLRQRRALSAIPERQKPENN